MKVIAFANQKGGTGKSTLALNVAGYFQKVRGLNVHIVDRDPQGGASRIFFNGEQPYFPVNDNINTPLKVVLEVSESQGADLVVIDTPPSLGGAFRQIHDLADLIILPSRPARQDLQSTYYAIEDLKERNTTAIYAVALTQVEKGQVMTADIVKTVDSLKLPRFENFIGKRAVYVRAYSSGHTVFNCPLSYSGVIDARFEIGYFCGEIEDALGMNKKKGKR